MVQNKQIIETLTNELESLRSSKTEAEKRTETTIKALENQKARHLAEVEALHHRNHKLVLERDVAQRSAAEHKTKFEHESKDKEEAQKIGQNSCKELVTVRLERDMAIEKAININALVEQGVETVK